MRRCIKRLLPLLLLFSVRLIDANPVVLHFFNELAFDSSKWFLELTKDGRSGNMEPMSLDGCYLTSCTDTSFFLQGLTLDSTYLVITADSLQTLFRINPAGDVIRLLLLW